MTDQGSSGRNRVVLQYRKGARAGFRRQVRRRSHSPYQGQNVLWFARTLEPPSAASGQESREVQQADLIKLPGWAYRL